MYCRQMTVSISALLLWVHVQGENRSSCTAQRSPRMESIMIGGSFERLRAEPRTIELWDASVAAARLFGIDYGSSLAARLIGRSRRNPFCRLSNSPLLFAWRFGRSQSGKGAPPAARPGDVPRPAEWVCAIPPGRPRGDACHAGACAPPRLNDRDLFDLGEVALQSIAGLGRELDEDSAAVVRIGVTDKEPFLDHRL